MTIKEQLAMIGKDLTSKSSERLGQGIEYSVSDSLGLSLLVSEKKLDFFIASTHILNGKREFIIRSEDLENHHYTELSIALVVGDDVEYLDYPPYDTIVKHFK